MLILDRILVGGIRFVLDKIVSAVDQEMNDDTVLREQLLAGQMQLELGEISQSEFDAIEGDVLERLRVIQARRQGSATGPIAFSSSDEPGEGMRIVGAVAEFGGDDTGGHGE